MAYLSNHADVKIELGTGNEIFGLKSLPDFGGGSIESVEVTTLKETKKRYIAGLAESVSELAYTFNFDPVEAAKIQNVEKAGNAVEITVTLADGTKVIYDAKVSLTINAASSGAAMEMTMNTTVEGIVDVQLAGSQREDVEGEATAWKATDAE